MDPSLNDLFPPAQDQLDDSSLHAIFSDTSSSLDPAFATTSAADDSLPDFDPFRPGVLDGLSPTLDLNQQPHVPPISPDSFSQNQWTALNDQQISPTQHDSLNFSPQPLQHGQFDQQQMHFQHLQDQQQQLEKQQQQQQQQMNTAIIDDFFLKNGAYRPPVPCHQCKRQKLQCLILQTTEANPNPITSCSSCVALFRDCSLAERSKRQASSFETQLPVIGHLHGVNEEDDTLLPPGVMISQAGESSLAAMSRQAKRGGTRPPKKTRALTNWFAGHLDHPYPSEDDKLILSEQCGMTKTQVTNWFANARRRHRTSAQSLFNNNSTRVFRQGSPMPQSILSRMSPLERWRNSPPDDDAASATAIEKALSSTSHDEGDFGSYGTGRGSMSSMSGDSAIYGHNDASSNSASSVRSHQSAEIPTFSLSARNSFDGEPSQRVISVTPAKVHTFQCTFCGQSFRKRYDWVRHERSIHVPGLDSWVCAVPLTSDESFLVWRVNHEHPECIFCGKSSPTHEHIQSHEFSNCAGRPISERTFTRKDHLWQHLHKFHRCEKWEGWKPNLNLLQHRQDKVQSQCGFCQVTLNSWDERAQHLAGHFRKGSTMAEWTGDCGIKLPDDQIRT